MCAKCHLRGGHPIGDMGEDVWPPPPKRPFLHLPKSDEFDGLSSTLIYTRGGAIPPAQDTAAVVGQFLPYKIWIGQSPWELLPQTFDFQRRGPNSAPPGDCQYNDILVLVWNHGRQFTEQPICEIWATWLNCSLDGGDPNMLVTQAILSLLSVTSRRAMFADT